MGHSVIPPSSAKVWGAPNGCTGWPTVNAMYPETEKSEPALDGTACHTLGEKMILAQAGSVEPVPQIGDPIEDRVVTKEMYEAAELYASVVVEEMRKAKVFGGPCLGIEEHIKAPRIHELSEGTVDAYVFDEARMHLFIGDLKYGYGLVEVFENWQLINYFAGIYKKLSEAGFNLKAAGVRITFCIVQPRAYHKDGTVRRWETDFSTLQALCKTLHDNAAIALGPDATTHSGDHCKYCRGRLSCEAAQRAGFNAIEASGDVMPMNISDAELANLYGTYKRGLEQLKYIMAALEEDMKRRLRGGKSIPEYKLENTRGRRVWAQDENKVAETCKLLDYDITKRAIMSPAQAEEAGVPKDVVAMYAEHISGLKIKESNLNEARAIFSRKV